MICGTHIQIANALAIEFGLGYYHMTRHQVRLRLMIGRQRGLHTQQEDTLLILLVHHHTNTVAYMQDCIHIGQLIIPIRAHQTRNNQVEMAQLTQIADISTLYLRIGQQQVNILNLLLYLVLGCQTLLLLIQTNLEEPSHSQERQDYTYHTQRICHSITTGDIRIHFTRYVRKCLLRSTQTRCIGHRTKQHTRHRSYILTREQVDKICHHTTQQHDTDRQHIELNAALSKRREETGTHLQTYGIHKQYQSKILSEGLHYWVEVHTEMRHRYRTKQNPSDTQSDTLKLQSVTKINTYSNRYSKNKNRMWYSRTKKQTI